VSHTVCHGRWLLQSAQQYDALIHQQEKIMARKPELPDPDEVALIQWCTEVEELFVAAGASREESQQHIEDEAEWFTDMFYEGLTPAEAAKAALNQ